MNPSLQASLATAAQDPAAAVDVLSRTDDPLWPYWVAISALATVVVTLFGLLMKSYRDAKADQRGYAEEIKNLNKGFADATDEKSKRVSEEFARKDKAILDTSVEFAKLMERVANELSLLNDRERTR